ncbi:acetyl-CoA acetyltransferase [Enterococcus silesiacus]|uniref:acetyl-CoA C-acyltransferase n=1 Tax=Enterococcus silesiacus TaxID=332949 RepID=A0A0S3K7W8_9ENTE|nr:thiolase family protein [Enterococcus silesiacus]ALS00396.1 acetyl-CoA acetyltransferase [Enterococcus silesiacus]OJG85349.1 acetyl-CoA acetyltransferase [Enterococcus silesiacus]
MSKNVRDVVIVAYGRSAISKTGKKGALREANPVDFAGEVLKGVLAKIPELETEAIDDLIVGCAKPEYVQGYNVARIIGLRAGLPWSVAGQTVNRFCSSGLQTISIGANAIAVGQAEVIVAGGVESMSAIPMGSDPKTWNPWVAEHEKGAYMPMGLTAENVAEKYNISREAMDAFAVESHLKATVAQESGVFNKEIIPVSGIDEAGQPIIFDQDQGIRKNSSMESLGKLPTVFKEDGKVTAGTASQTSNGASFVVLMTREKAGNLGIKPIAVFKGFSVAGVDPSLMGIGPIYAVPRVLKQTGLTVDEMDVIELNEAFAAQALPCIKELNFDKEKVNPNGGAIALGHPLGATGSILVSKALNQLERIQGKYGLVTMCIGGGMGAAAVLEMCD